MLKNCLTASNATAARNLAALRGPAPAEQDVPPDLVAWLRRLDTWLSAGHFDGFGVDGPGECAQLRVDLARAIGTDPALHAHLTACVAFLEIHPPPPGSGAVTQEQKFIAAGIQGSLALLDAPAVSQVDYAIAEVDAPRG